MRFRGAHSQKRYLELCCLTALAALSVVITQPASSAAATTSVSSGNESGAEMQNLSTHILDTALGKPAREVPVTLYRQGPNQTWTKISTGITDEAGRFRNFFDIGQQKLQTGVYKMHFDIEPYFRGRNVESLYPFIEVVFAVSDASQHYHIPLILSPFGYSTYRGS
ncbi:probable 5-hydroxyisourate hydrolase R09H10.3 [Anopheles nili]|uniref:probable 5-hydroxyisourate hydrolase R09H10.3 n=1 Tax=Anopheles nili TaxID=185578 RepID=UPI00237AA952|nr:probable 5-hydroxyisourate hydrolase R09H10.3 [Anopheles nili]